MKCRGGSRRQHARRHHAWLLSQRKQSNLDFLKLKRQNNKEYNRETDK
jgi:hypothetical protein